MELEQVVREHWGFEGSVAGLGEGHINDTYLVTTPVERYVLQRVNRFVFRDAEQLMVNLERVVDHLSAHRPNWTPRLIKTHEGAPYEEVDGAIWRLWSYVEGRSLSELESDRQAFTAGVAFGETQRYLRDLAGPQLADPIDGFLQLDHCLARYDDHAGKQPASLVAFVDERRHLADRFRVRDRYVHGDCKVNNLLFDDRDEVCAVLDLDTVMWGNWAWDFGDLARSACVIDGRLSLERFALVCNGFLEGSKIAATADDLASAPLYVTYMLGVRFLTDHLAGDRYFKTSQPGENLLRAEQQFELLASLEDETSEMRSCAERLLAGGG
ncbi:MAG: aminoglycoside phosphotransferase family protein [Gammaproteobacteria bacterium]|nr:aminoglycoside phosphotransferase family protein [Gammaproteobacteria bacterium]